MHSYELRFAFRVYIVLACASISEHYASNINTKKDNFESSSRNVSDLQIRRQYDWAKMPLSVSTNRTLSCVKLFKLTGIDVFIVIMKQIRRILHTRRPVRSVSTKRTLRCLL